MRGEARRHQPKDALDIIHCAGAVDGEVIQPEDRSREMRESHFENDGQGAHVGIRPGPQGATLLDHIHDKLSDLAQAEVLAPADLEGLIDRVRHVQRPDQTGDHILDPQRLEQGLAATRQRQEARREGQQHGQAGGEVILRAKEDRGAQNGVGYTALADGLLGNALGFEHGEGRGAVGIQVAEVEQALDPGVGGSTHQVARAFDIHGHQVGSPALRLAARHVIDHVHVVHGGAQTAFVAQAGDRHFHRHTQWQGGRTRRGAQEYAHLMPRLCEMTYQGAADEAGSTRDKDHGADYSRDSSCAAGQRLIWNMHSMCRLCCRNAQYSGSCDYNHRHLHLRKCRCENR